jgi:hypothetical protein
VPCGRICPRKSYDFQRCEIAIKNAQIDVEFSVCTSQYIEQDFMFSKGLVVSSFDPTTLE